TPFFLFLHTFVVHDYFLDPELPRFNFRDCLLGKATCGEGEWARLREQYLVELKRFDASFGRLREAIARLKQPTLLVLVSAHGEAFDCARGRLPPGGRLHQDLIHVPLLMAGVGISARRIEQPVSLVDVVPTALDLLHVRAPPELDGRSVAALLDGGRLEP